MRTFDEINEDVWVAMKRSDADALLRLADEFRTLGSDVAEAAALNVEGSVSFFKARYDVATDLYKRSIAAYEQLGVTSGMAAVHANIGNCYRIANDTASAIEHFQRALELYREAGNDRGIASVHHYLGSIFLGVGQLGPALEHYNRSLDIWTQLNDVDAQSQLYTSIGMLYRSVSDYPRSLEYYHRALSINETTNNRHVHGVILSSIAGVYLDTGEYHKALEHYQRALQIQHELDIPRSVAVNHINLGITFQHLGDAVSALQHFTQALQIYTEMGSMADVASVQLNMAQYYFDRDRYEDCIAIVNTINTDHLTDPRTKIMWHNIMTMIYEHQHDHEKAREELHAALTIADAHSMLSSQALLHKNLRDNAQHTNDLAKYITHNNEYLRITDAINGKETSQRIATLEAERKIAAERQEHEKHLAVLHSTLPKHIADRVIRGEHVNDHFDNAAVMFADIVGFTTLSASLSASEVVALLERIYATFDAICERHNVTKVKTIGDSYMAVAFPEESVPHDVRNDNVPTRPLSVEERMAAASLEMLRAVADITIPRVSQNHSSTNTFRSPEGSPEGSPVRVRLGVHCGALTAGVIGTQRLQYDVWGDTVNVASRLESTGEPGRIHISEDFALALKGELAHGTWHLALRGDTELKGKGTVTTYWLEQYT